MLIVLVLVLSVISGCSSKSAYDMPTESPESSPSENSMDAAIEEGGQDGKNLGLGPVYTGGVEPDKVITTIFLGFETTEFENSLERMYALIEENKGYISSSNIYFRNYYDTQRMRSGEFAIRIPRDKVNQFKNQISDIGNLVNESSSKEDVTTYYTDTESRLKVLEIKESRLLSLLEKAEKIEDIIALENQLSQVISEKEELKKTLVSLDDRIDYSTVNLSLEEVRKISTTETKETSFVDRIGNAFNNSLYQFRRSAENFAVSLVYNLPFLLVLLIIIIIIYKIIRKIVKPKKKEKEAKTIIIEDPKEDNKNS
jgi:TolA-binding protein